MVKVALLIGVSEYAEGLNPLPSAVRDIEAMRQVLQSLERGGFDEVKILPNPEPMAMQEAVENLFSGRAKEDLALLFFSGHGVKDDSGRLYFATYLTRKNSTGTLVKATAVPAGFLQDVMSNSRCKRQVVILDCCFSGAFAEGMTAKDDGTVDVQTQLGGEGRAVLTSSTSTQYSFEQQGAELSVYTRFLVEGIETGAADTDNDGWTSIDELHDYARKKVQEAAPAMKPKIYAVEEGFKIHLAKAPASNPKLTYRKEVERFASRGTISSIGRGALNLLQTNLGLTSEEAISIEQDVLKPHQEYRKRLKQYEQVLVQEIKKRSPLTPEIWMELGTFQEALGLRNEDIKPILARVAPKEARRLESQSGRLSNFKWAWVALCAGIVSLGASWYWFVYQPSQKVSPLFSPIATPASSSPAPPSSIATPASSKATPDSPSPTSASSSTAPPSSNPIPPNPNPAPPSSNPVPPSSNTAPPNPDAGKIQVPDVIALSWMDAQAQIRSSNLEANFELQSDGTPDGKIIDQHPQPGTFVEPGTSISLVLVGAYGPDTCLQGYVWRDAFPGDHVCVTPETRAQAASDNNQAAARRDPSGGAYGPDTCLQGYVWRGAFPDDHVCVTPETRAQAASDNSQAAARRVIP